MPSNPWMKTLTLTNANQAYSLFALMKAADVTLKYAQCAKLQIQSKVDGGAARLQIGNDDVSAVNRGVELVASQAFGIEAIELNLILLDQIFLWTDTAGLTINVTMMVH
jgi:hypothetical protein